MTKLILGVADIPYSEPAEAPKKVPKKRTKLVKPKKPQAVITTGMVAEILEREYGVMRTFFDQRENDIAEALEGSVGEYFEALLMGAPATMDVFGPANQVIQEKFRNFLTSKAMDGLVPGVPTKASLLGVSHRFKNKKGAPGRPSFVDTGQYEATMKSWAED